MTPPTAPMLQNLMQNHLTGSGVSAPGLPPYNPLNLPPLNPPHPSAINGFAPTGANPMMPVPVAMVSSGFHTPPPSVQPYAASPPGLVYPTLPPLAGHGHHQMMGRPVGRLI